MKRREGEGRENERGKIERKERGKKKRKKREGKRKRKFESLPCGASKLRWRGCNHDLPCPS